MATGDKGTLLGDAVTKCYNSQEAETDTDRLTSCQIAKIKVMARLVFLPMSRNLPKTSIRLLVASK